MTTQPTPEQRADSIAERYLVYPLTGNAEGQSSIREAIAHAIREACKAAEADRDALRARCEELESSLETSRRLCDAFREAVCKATGETDGVRAVAMLMQLREDNQRLHDALDKARPVPPGHVRDEKGVDHPMLGKLVFDKHGRAIGMEGEFWTIHMGVPILCYLGCDCYTYIGIERTRKGLAVEVDPDEYDADELHTLYESREAAEGAKEAGNG